MIKHFEDKNFNFKAEIIQDRKTAANLYKSADPFVRFSILCHIHAVIRNVIHVTNHTQNALSNRVYVSAATIRVPQKLKPSHYISNSNMTSHLIIIIS